MSPLKALQIALAAGATLVAAAQVPASAGDATEDRAAAITACRTAIAAAAGVEPTIANVDLDRARTKPRVIELRFQVHGQNGATWQSQCDVRRATGEVAELTHGPGAVLAGGPSQVAAN